MPVDVYQAQCATKACRDLMAKRIEEMAAEIGAEAIREDMGRMHSRGIYMRVSRGPYYVTMSFDGDSRVGAFLGHWNIASGSDATFPRDFLETPNQFHFCKATTCTDSFLQFRNRLMACFMQLASLDQTPAT